MQWSDVQDVTVEPSLYAADFSRLGEQIAALLAAGARVFHFDVGDGHFVPPITVGPIVLKWIVPLVHQAGGLLDCHLMVDNPERHIEAFAEAGADSVTVHVEVSDEPAALVALARDHGLAAGLAVNPDTALETLVAATDGFALVNCMSVHPGYSGQSFIPGSVERVRTLRELLPREVKIQVDGGVGADNAAVLRDAGADLLVAATSIFGGDDPPAAYRKLANLVE